MSEFELATIALSFIVGFGVTAILAAVVDLLTQEAPLELDWMPLAWAGFIFVELVNYWFGVLFIGQEVGLGVDTFWALILLASCLYLAGALILPSNDRRAEVPALDDFDRFGRRALVPYAAFNSGAVFVNVQAGMAATDPPNLANVVLSLTAILVFGSKKRSRQRVLTVLYGVGLAYGLIFLWSRPGAVGITN